MDSQTEINKELASTLSPEQKAMLQIVENFQHIEANLKNEGADVVLTWGNSHKPTDKLLQQIKEWGDTNSLPLPKQHGMYDMFSFKVEYPNGNNAGSSEIRIYQPGGDSLLLNGIVGSFQGMDETWAKAVDGVDYPIAIRDQQGFEYTNKKYQEVHPVNYK